MPDPSASGADPIEQLTRGTHELRVVDTQLEYPPGVATIASAYSASASFRRSTGSAPQAGVVINNDVTINGSQNTVVQSGQNRGAISASALTAVGSMREVSALLAELRTKVAATDVDKRAVIDDNLDEDIQ